MALPQFYRVIVVNNSGQTVTYNSNGRYNLKMTGILTTPSDGKQDYDPLAADDLSFVGGDSTIDGAEEKSDEIDNTTNLYKGVQVQLEVTHDEGATADGTFDMYLDGGDTTAQLMSDASGYASAEASGLVRIGSLVWESNAIDDEVIRSPVFNLGGE